VPSPKNLVEPALPPYTVIRDDREKPGHGWFFGPSDTCEGTTIARLLTGDYTLQGLEAAVAIERKASAAELSRNFFANFDTFRAEMERLQQLEYAVVVCEFPITHILEFPRHEQLGNSIKRRLRIDANRLAKRLESLRRDFPNVQFVFDAHRAERRAERFFDRVWQLRGPSIVETPTPLNLSPLQDLRSHHHGETACLMSSV